jgi:hypothetical protein
MLMNLLVIVVIVVISILIYFRRKKTHEETNTIVINLNNVDIEIDKYKDKKYKDEYEFWLDIFKEEKSNIKEFDLFGTKAAIAWNDGDDVVIVICITAFTNKKPITKTWNYFEFNIKERYWIGRTPRGALGLGW